MTATTPDRIISNRFAKKCETCHHAVDEGRGYAVLVGGAWSTYCPAHMPYPIPGVVAPRRELTVDGKIVTPYEPGNLALIKSFPGARWDAESKTWAFSLAIGDRPRVLELADKLGLTVPAALRTVSQSPQAERAAAIGLYPYQIEGVDWLAKRRKSLLADDMGLGKSVETLMSLPRDARALVVCPASLKYNWLDESTRWTPHFKVTVLSGHGSFRLPEAGEVVICNYTILPDYLITRKPGILTKEQIARKVATRRRQAVAKYILAKIADVEEVIDQKVAAKYDVVNTPRRRKPIDLTEFYQEVVKELVAADLQGSDWVMMDVERYKKQLRDEQAILNRDKTVRATHSAPDAIVTGMHEVHLITDEIHACRSYDAAQTKKIHTLSRLAHTVVGLTGTPLMNHPNQLFSVLDSLNLARDVFGSWNRFVELFNGYKNKWNGMEWGEPAPIVPELMRRVMLRRTREEVLPDLPRKTYTTIPVEITSTQLRSDLDDLYDDYEGSFLAEGDEGDLPAFSEFSSIRARLAADRLDTVLEIVQSYEDQETPLIVASAHRSVIDALGERKGWKTITGDTPNEQRQPIVRDFQNGRGHGIALTIQAGGVGLTLTRAHVMLFVDKDWTPALNVQCSDRICRLGQKSDKCQIISLVSDHPLDKHIDTLIEHKMRLIAGSIEDSILASPVPQVETVEAETPEQYAARMAEVDRYLAAQKETQEALRVERDKTVTERAKSKAGDLYKYAKRRAGDESHEPELTEEIVVAVRGALAMMLSVCDGAFERDFQGFNAPDAPVARTIAHTGLETETEIRAAERMLVRYHRQLHESFPILFWK